MPPPRAYGPHPQDALRIARPAQASRLRSSIDRDGLDPGVSRWSNPPSSGFGDGAGPRRPNVETRPRPPASTPPPAGTPPPIDEPPLRAELFSVAQLEQHARLLASAHVVTSLRRRAPDRLLPRLGANEASLSAALGLVTEAVQRGRRITPAAEWFIDNYHLIEEQIRTARRHLPRNYSRQLPRLTSGLPRVYDLVLELVSHAHGRLDIEGLRAFITAYQAVHPLDLGELWAIPIMLRLALIENLRRVVASVTAGRNEREAASAWVDRMVDISTTAPGRVVLVLAELVEANPPLTPPFAAELASRLQGLGPGLTFPVAWLEQRLAEHGETIEQVFRLVSQSQAADQVSIGNSIGSLRLLGATDWRVFVEAMSVVEQRLATDPAGVYSTMDFATRDRYRHVVELLARRTKRNEATVAEAAIAQARASSPSDGTVPSRTDHVGYHLIDDGRAALERALGVRPSAHRARFELYAAAIICLTLSITALLGVVIPARGPRLMLGLMLIALATSQLATAIVQWLATLLTAPQLLPRLDFSGGIPAAHHTLVAVPTMLTDLSEIDGLIEALEVRYLANRDPHLAFALITDLRDAPTEHQIADQALLDRARDGIAALNARHAQRGRPTTFHLFHRSRRWNPGEGVWMGWERKRGKLEQLNGALRGKLEAFSTLVGDVHRLGTVRYVIVLDSDTQLPRDSARELAGILAHPLNRPRIDPALGRVVEGYTILQPRVAITMASARRSRFAALFTGELGIDPYTRAVSDVYQDLFAEGSFIGKGIYDVDAFHAAIGGRFPEDRVLSHDLLEGAYGRAGLVSDVLLFEDFPSSHAVEVVRRRRWTRGDWQIAGWLGRKVPAPAGGESVRNPLSRLSQWKILDNLRRSLVPLAWLVLLFLGWLWPGLAALTTLVIVACVMLPGLIATATSLVRVPDELPLGRHVSEKLRDYGLQLLREAFALACLPHDALISAGAIARTAVRMRITHRHLLEWRTASDAQGTASTGLAGAYASMSVAPLTALGAATLLALVTPDALPWAAPLLVGWLLAPALSWWLGRPLPSDHVVLSAADTARLHRVARRTWRFFEDFVVAADNHLPPDNVQEDPPRGVAHRTSPTNIGLALTANLAAYDFGYLSAAEMVERCDLTLTAVEKLERHRTHLYNWYDTRTLEPLLPRYVSTVDSGNFAAHLVVLASGLHELATHPIVTPTLFAGLADTRAVLDAVEAAARSSAPDAQRGDVTLEALDPAPPRTLSDTRARLDAVLAHAAVRAAHAAPGEAAEWARAFETQARRALAELVHLAPWLAHRGGDPTLDTIPTLAQLAARAADPELPGAIALGAQRAAARLAAVASLAARATALADLDYDLLYDRRRHLLSIGYDVSDHRLDAGTYDMLASEARLASYLAVAQGKLPQEHWFSLGRQITQAGGAPALLSWSGSMFEYLMPLLVMPTHRATILDETYHAVVARQIAYGRERSVPWGVSESGYNKTDAHLNYQYRAFGVPGLGFKRGLADDLVIAPYASALALMVAPQAAADNLRRLEDQGLLGPHGFYEAVDYTPSRLPPGKDSATVASYMAHHQGMSFLALDHLLCDRPMQRRFDADPELRATELLLQERVPRMAAIYPHPAEVSAAAEITGTAGRTLRVFTTADTPTPQVQLLSNGTYHVMITNAGGGYSRYRDLAVTRWTEDPTRDAWGSFCYLRDVGSGATWSTAHHPTGVRATSYEAIFSPGRAEFRRRDGDLATHVEISVSPEDDVEVRRVSITNLGRTARKIELTSYAEVVLAAPAADAAHPAFSNLFVETERLDDALLCTRRPRSASERPPWMFHVMAVDGEIAAAPSYETARDAFIGRGRTVADPRALHRAVLQGGLGAVLDPIVAIRNTVVIAPDQSVRVHLITGVAPERADVVALVDKYRDRHAAERVFELSWTHSQVLLRRLDVTETDTQLFQRLAGHILYSSPALRAPRAVIARNVGGQSSLWAYAISGDLPIALVRIAHRAHIGLVRQMVQAHAYFRHQGLAMDLVIWNEDPSGYRQVLHEEITAVVGTLGETELLDRPGGIFLRRTDQVSEEDKVLLQTVARLVVVDTDGPLETQLDRRPPLEVDVPAMKRRSASADARAAAKPVDVVARSDLKGWNGWGGFTPDGREYVIVTSREHRTPAPWVNVLANPYFGTVISESGSAYTWCENARNYRLTPWNNDPVSDVSGEAFYLRDEHDGRFWSPTPGPAPGRQPYTTRHGFGYSVFEHTSSGLSSELRTFVATDAPLKLMLFKLSNRSGRARRISLTALFELVLGEKRPSNLPYVVTEVDASSGALLARNTYNGEFARRVAFLDSSEEIHTYSGDRREMIGRNGGLSDPACMSRARLSGRVGAALDPCLAMQVTIDLADGQERELAFTFGSGMDLADARTLIHRFRGVAAAKRALDGVWQYWNRTLGTVHVETPDATVDFLANGWLLYQTLAARMWGRSGFYQSGGAFGFRDQLQDAMALVHAEPGMLREQIVRCASRQFREGDVQHWWHPPLGRGVRTRISDDYLWLPYAVCRYIENLGDTGVLDEPANYLEGRTVKPDEESYYDLPLRSAEAGSVYEHCVRAIDNGLNFGVHGLPLMGSGDWNDGMNLVGEHGQGESVWLAFFLHDVLIRFAPVATARGDAAFAERCTTMAEALREAIEAHAWDGAWYRRAYFDNGEPLGSSENVDCQIDSLPQSWSVLTRAGDPARARQALASLEARLVKPEMGLIQLFDPPFDHAGSSPGYVKGYVPGVRENGGQYTHAAVWAVMAFAEAGEIEKAWSAFRLINPLRHGDSAETIARYQVEPYVVAADVYTNPQHAGRGGWTWYTGSAGWMYRLVLESLLGLRLEVDRLRMTPLLPRGWGRFVVHYRHRGTVHHITVRGPDGGGRVVDRVLADGVAQPSRTIPLCDDGREHNAEVWVREDAPLP